MPHFEYGWSTSNLALTCLNEIITLVGKGLSCISKENVRIFLHFHENVRIFTEMCTFSKNKFSEIGLDSSKGISSKDPIIPKPGTYAYSN